MLLTARYQCDISLKRVVLPGRNDANKMGTANSFVTHVGVIQYMSIWRKLYFLFVNAFAVAQLLELWERASKCSIWLRFLNRLYFALQFVHLADTKNSHRRPGYCETNHDQRSFSISRAAGTLQQFIYVQQTIQLTKNLPELKYISPKSIALIF